MSAVEGGFRCTPTVYKLPDMPYDYGALEPAMSGQILELHHSKHHAAYVKGSNDTLDQLAEARDKGDYSTLVGLEKTLAFNLSGHVLHSIFWNNLSPEGGERPDASRPVTAPAPLADNAPYERPDPPDQVVLPLPSDT